MTDGKIDRENAIPISTIKNDKEISQLSIFHRLQIFLYFFINTLLCVITFRYKRWNWVDDREFILVDWFFFNVLSTHYGLFKAEAYIGFKKKNQVNIFFRLINISPYRSITIWFIVGKKLGSCLSEWYVRVCNEPDWHLTLLFLTPSHRPLHHPHILRLSISLRYLKRRMFKNAMYRFCTKLVWN